MPILMKKFLSKHSRLLLTLVFGICVFIFWRMRYPFALTFQEQLQLFLFDDDYFLERIAEPGGLARYIAEFLVQFYNSTTIGAAIIAILMMLLQRLTWQLMRCEEHYCLSFLPAILLWYAMGDESVMLTYTVALVMAMTSAWALMTAFPKNDNPRGQIIAKSIALFILIPIIYWHFKAK